MITDQQQRFLAKAAQDRGTPCYAYFLSDIRQQFTNLREAFGVGFLLAMP
ncbi:MAG: hypothetical protein P8N76_20675 [Pirellulaceae bacterium]|nr:hypothetical protein [Pirellulaceae bacterium]